MRKVRNVVTYDICMLSVTALESLYKTTSHHFLLLTPYIFIHTAYQKQTVIYTSAEEGLL